MDFFKSVFSEPDPDSSPPPGCESEPTESTPPASATGGGWGFGGLMKTFASRSESVLEAYRRDLAEFGTGLRRETEAFRDAAARAARDLPSSTHALDGIADIVSHGKDALLAAAAAAAAADADAAAAANSSESEPASAGRRRYSRYEAQLLAIQSDPNTFTSDPDDVQEFMSWKAGFNLEGKEEEIETLCYENDALETMVERLVPDAVDRGTFWARYFYRVHKLKQAEDARAELVKRVIAREDEEDLSWEVDDDDDDEEEVEGQEKKGQEIEEKKEESKVQEERKDKVEAAVASPEIQKDMETPQAEVFGSSMVIIEKEVPAAVEKAETSEANVEESKPMTVGNKNAAEESNSKSGDDVQKEGKNETSDSSKDSEYSVVSSKPPVPEEDELEWDEIEDLGEHDEKNASGSSSSPALKEDLRKRLSVAEDDEDLSWDIEDDDDVAKP